METGAAIRGNEERRAKRDEARKQRAERREQAPA